MLNQPDKNHLPFVPPLIDDPISSRMLWLLGLARPTDRSLQDIAQAIGKLDKAGCVKREGRNQVQHQNCTFMLNPRRLYRAIPCACDLELIWKTRGGL